MSLDGWSIAALVLGAVTLIAGGAYLFVKTKLAEVVEVLRQVVELHDVTVAAAEDKKFSDEEKAAIKKEFEDVKAAAKVLVAKKAA